MMRYILIIFVLLSISGCTESGQSNVGQTNVEQSNIKKWNALITESSPLTARETDLIETATDEFTNYAINLKDSHLIKAQASLNEAANLNNQVLEICNEGETYFMGKDADKKLYWEYKKLAFEDIGKGISSYSEALNYAADGDTNAMKLKANRADVYFKSGNDYIERANELQHQIVRSK